MQASYNPIPDVNGKPFKVVKYATDVTEQMVRNADYDGQLAAINKAQAVIEFDLDGTIRKLNDNFAARDGLLARRGQGQAPQHVRRGGLRGERRVPRVLGEAQSRRVRRRQFKRIAKGGREVWIQAAVQPDPGRERQAVQGRQVRDGCHRRPMQAQQALQVAVQQTQDVVKHAIDGDLTHRIPMDGKTGDLEALCRGVNSLLDRPATSSRR